MRAQNFSEYIMEQESLNASTVNPSTDTSPDTQETVSASTETVTSETVVSETTSAEVNPTPVAETASVTAEPAAIDASTAETSDAPASTDETQAEADAPAVPKLKSIVRGVIAKQVRQMAFLILESGQEAYINVSDLVELRDEQGNLPIGQEIEAEVVSTRSGIKLSRSYITRERELDTLEAAFNGQASVQGRVSGTNKGGFEVRIGNLNAFCPRSRFSQRRDGNPQKHVGKMLDFQIEEFKRGGRPRIVLTRLPLLEREKRERAELMGERFQVGDEIEGQVTQLTKFGVFVSVGDQIEGLIPMSELKHERVESASDVVSVNDTVTVKVINVDVARGRLSLSLRAMTPDSWDAFIAENAAGGRISGKITRITDFGAFVELAPQIEGLLHISAISTQGRLNHPSEKVSEGQDLELVIEEIIDNPRPDKRRIRLMTPEVAERRAPVQVSVKAGDVVKLPVKSVQERGITVEVATGLEGFIPASETGTQRGTNLQERFPVGSEVEAKLLTLDIRRRRARLSIKALATHEEDVAYKAFRSEMRSDESRMRSTFGDLLKNFD